MYKVKSFEEAVSHAAELIHFAGRGHTSVHYTAQHNEDRIKHFSDQLDTGRILINTPASQGGIGDLYNFRLDPSLTLGARIRILLTNTGCRELSHRSQITDC